MTHTDQIVRLEEQPKADGSLERVFLAAVQADAEIAGETKYWEIWLTPEQVADYGAAKAAGTLVQYLTTLVGSEGDRVNQGWRAEIAARPPAPKVYRAEEIRTLLPEQALVSRDSTGKPVVK